MAALRQGAARQDRGAQGARAHRHRAPRRVRAPVVAGVGVAPDRAACCKGLHKRRPAVFNIYTPCPVEHGLADDWSQHAARLALESRAFPFLTYDPDAGPTLRRLPEPRRQSVARRRLADLHAQVPGRRRRRAGARAAAHDRRLGRDRSAVQAALHRGAVATQWNDAMMPFHEYLALAADEREGSTPFILARRARTARCAGCACRAEIVQLAEERQQFWSQLRAAGRARDLARRARRGGRRARGGIRAAAGRAARRVRGEDRRAARRAIRRRSRAGWPRDCCGTAAARRRWRSCWRRCPRWRAPCNGNGAAVAAAPAPAPAAAPAARPRRAARHRRPRRQPRRSPRRRPPSPRTTTRSSLEAYIDSARCTTCNECTNLNKKMFAYNADKQAYVKDAQRRHVPAAGDRGRALPGVDHPPGHAAQPEGEGSREVGRSARAKFN